MRARSHEADKYAVVTANAMGRGTSIPFYFEPFTEPKSDDMLTQMDAVAALMLRYRVLELQWTGSFSYSGSMTDPADNSWSASASGNWSYTRRITTSAQVEGDFLKSPTLIADALAGNFNGTAHSENATTGDTFSTSFVDPDPPQWRLNFEFGPGAELTRGLKLMRNFRGEKIGVELYALALMSGVRVSSEGPGGSISTMVDYQWFTDNSGGAGSSTATCEVDVKLITPDTIDLEVFTTTQANPQVFIGSPFGDGRAGSASSRATMKIVGSDPWPYGLNPSNPIEYTTERRCWGDDGTPQFTLSQIVRAPMSRES